MSTRVVRATGRVTLGYVRELGAVTRLLVDGVRRVPDARETLRAAVTFGVRALSLTAATALFIGAILVLQTSAYVREVGAREAVGWAAGYALLREFGPLLFGLVLAGRIGARNAAELATLSVGEQLDALSLLGVSTTQLIVAPRILAATFAVGLLVAIGDAVALGSATLLAYASLDLPLRVFLGSVETGLSAADLFAGLTKGFAYGAAIAVLSSRAGLRARGGARAVGRAATTAVVQSALAILVLDAVLTRLQS